MLVLSNCNCYITKSANIEGKQRETGQEVDLLQVSLLINKQTGGKKTRRDRKVEGELDMWTTRSENEIGQDLDRRLSFMLAKEPIKLEQVNAEPRFRSEQSTSLALPPFPLSFPSLFFFCFSPVCLLIKNET